MAKEAGEAAGASNTPSSAAREETSSKTRESIPGTDKKADGATNIRTTSPNTTRDKMTMEEPVESALVIQRQHDQEARETTAARTTPSSVAREDISGKAREENPGTDKEAQEAVSPASRPMVQDYTELRPMVQDYAELRVMFQDYAELRPMVQDYAKMGPTVQDNAEPRPA